MLYRAREIGVVGLGYVGLPLAVAFAEAGLRVVGIEKDPQKQCVSKWARRGRRGISLPPAAGR